MKTTERISIDEAIRLGYVFGPCGYDHAQGRRLIAPLGMIRKFSLPSALIDVAVLDEIRDGQADPAPAGDIPTRPKTQRIVEREP